MDWTSFDYLDQDLLREGSYSLLGEGDANCTILRGIREDGEPSELALSRSQRAETEDYAHSDQRQRIQCHHLVAVSRAAKGPKRVREWPVKGNLRYRKKLQARHHQTKCLECGKFVKWPRPSDKADEVWTEVDVQPPIRARGPPKTHYLLVRSFSLDERLNDASRGEAEPSRSDCPVISSA